MAKYAIKVRTESRIKTLTIVASEKTDALRIAGFHGSIISADRIFSLDFSKGMSRTDRYLLLYNLAMNLQGRNTQEGALKVIAETFGGKVALACYGLLDQVELGMDLPMAMELDRKNFPIVTTALIKAGWYSGNSWKALLETAEFENKMSQSVKGALGRLWQGIMMYLSASGVVLYTTIWGGPQVMSMPIFKKVDMTWAVITGNVAMAAMAICLLIFLFFIGLATIGRRLSPIKVDTFILGIPYYRELVLARNNQVAFYTMSVLLESGVELDKSLSYAHDSMPTSGLRSDFGLASKYMKEGKPWFKGLRTLLKTDRAALQMSTDMTEIARSFRMMSTYYADVYLQRINAVAPMIAMVASLFLALAGFVMYAQMVMPSLMLTKMVGPGMGAGANLPN